jgi:hypothetical protein
MKNLQGAYFIKELVEVIKKHLSGISKQTILTDLWFLSEHNELWYGKMTDDSDAFLTEAWELIISYRTEKPISERTVINYLKNAYGRLESGEFQEG